MWNFGQVKAVLQMLPAIQVETSFIISSGSSFCQKQETTDNKFRLNVQNFGGWLPTMVGPHSPLNSQLFSWNIAHPPKFRWERKCMPLDALFFAAHHIRESPGFKSTHQIAFRQQRGRDPVIKPYCGTHTLYGCSYLGNARTSTHMKLYEDGMPKLINLLFTMMDPEN